MKSGWKTSEFWVSIGASLLGIMVVMGWITTDVQSELLVAIEKIAGGVIAAVAAISYIFSRTKVKASDEKNAKAE